MQRPDVFQYDTHGTFMGDMLSWLRETTTYMSYRWAAKRLEVAPGNLVNIVKGTRKLPEDRIGPACDIFKLTTDESEYFSLLVAHDHASTDEARRAFRDAMTGHRRIRKATPWKPDEANPIAHWWVAAVRELLSMPQASADAKWIASVMVPPISADQAQAAIDSLRDAGLLPGQLTDNTVSSGHQAAPGVGLTYMTEVIELGSTATARIAQEERFVVAFTATVSQAGWQTMVKRLERMTEVMLDHCESDPNPPDRVLQFNVQAFPVATVPPRKK